jgi:hypothetical protein
MDAGWRIAVGLLEMLSFESCCASCCPGICNPRIAINDTELSLGGDYVSRLSRFDRPQFYFAFQLGFALYGSSIRARDQSGGTAG